MKKLSFAMVLIAVVALTMSNMAFGAELFGFGSKVDFGVARQSDGNKTKNFLPLSDIAEGRNASKVAKSGVNAQEPEVDQSEEGYMPMPEEVEGAVSYYPLIILGDSWKSNIDLPKKQFGDKEGRGDQDLGFELIDFEEDCVVTDEGDEDEILREMFIRIMQKQEEALEDARIEEPEGAFSFEPYVAGDRFLKWEEVSSASSYFAFFFMDGELVAHNKLEGANSNCIDLSFLRNMLEEAGVEWRGAEFLCVVRVYDSESDELLSGTALDGITLEIDEQREYPNELQMQSWNWKL